jgi:hypothetical protein
MDFSSALVARGGLYIEPTYSILFALMSARRCDIVNGGRAGEARTRTEWEGSPAGRVTDGPFAGNAVWCVLRCSPPGAPEVHAEITSGTRPLK